MGRTLILYLPTTDKQGAEIHPKPLSQAEQKEWIQTEAQRQFYEFKSKAPRAGKLQISAVAQRRVTEKPRGCLCWY